MEEIKMEIEVIELWPTIIECAVRGAQSELEYSISMYEGKIVDSTKTDEWAGMPVCKECYDKDALKKGYN